METLRNFRLGLIVSLFCFLSLFTAGTRSSAYEMADPTDVSPKKPVVITSVQLIFDRLKGLTLFKGNVKAVHDNVTLSADEIRAASQNREATADGKVRVMDPSGALTMTCGNLEYLDLMNLMTAHDHPMLTSLDENGRPVSISGRQMELDSKKKTVVIHQDVKIVHEDGRAEAQKATFLSKEDKFILEDSPKLIMNNGELSGRRIVSSLGSNRSVLVEGMAEAVFYPAGRPSGQSKDLKGPTAPNPDNRAPGNPPPPTVPSPTPTKTPGAAGAAPTPTPNAQGVIPFSSGIPK